jgi:hypothetical protein
MQLDIEPFTVDLSLLCISINMVPTILYQVVELLGVLIHRTVPLEQL